MFDTYDAIIEQFHVHRTTKVFDIGSGDGTLGLRMVEHGLCAQYKGLDRNPEAVIQLQKNGLHGEEGDLRWHDGMKFFWDTVVMKDVLEEFDNFELMSDAILRARRVFILATTAHLYDSLMHPAPDAISFDIDRILNMARDCSFYLAHFQMVGKHSILVFTRKFKRKTL